MSIELQLAKSLVAHPSTARTPAGRMAKVVLAQAAEIEMLRTEISAQQWANVVLRDEVAGADPDGPPARTGA